MTGPKARILILDDEERIRQLLRDFLEDFGEFALRTAPTAEDALEELARESAELCIVDMRLPGMNGQGFILAALDRGLCSRFLLHTGSMDFTLSEALVRRGLTLKDVFLKPCDMNDLLGRMREILNQPGA